MTPALLRLARCRHPKATVGFAFGFGCAYLRYCRNCGSYCIKIGGGPQGVWTRPKLVADLIAEKKGKGK